MFKLRSPRSICPFRRDRGCLYGFDEKRLREIATTRLPSAVELALQRAG